MTKEQKLLAVLTSLLTVAVLAANLGAVKIWDFYGIPIDGGVIIFPATYVVGDLLVELYGDRVANWASRLATVVNVVIALLLMVVVILPAYPGWDGQEAFSQVFGFSLRITAASLIAFMLSRWTNNWSFMRIKASQKREMFYSVAPSESDSILIRSSWKSQDYENFHPEVVKGYRKREFLSSLLGRLVDNMIFETIAFFGVLPLADFGKQAVMAYVEGVAIEATLIVLFSKPLVNFCRWYIKNPGE